MVGEGGGEGKTPPAERTALKALRWGAFRAASNSRPLQQRMSVSEKRNGAQKRESSGLGRALSSSLGFQPPGCSSKSNSSGRDSLRGDAVFGEGETVSLQREQRGERGGHHGHTASAKALW